jgi:hypothetical protein
MNYFLRQISQMTKKVDLAKVFSTYCSYREFMIINTQHKTREQLRIKDLDLYNVYYNVDCI